MRRRSSIPVGPGLAHLAAALIVLLVPVAADAQRDPQLPDPALRLERLIQDYRTKPIDPIVDDLSALVKEGRADAALRSWLKRRRSAEQERADLEAALMLYSETVMATWIREDAYPEGAVARYIPQLTRLLSALTAIDRRSPFLRGWYLLWETFGQAYDHTPLPAELDFLDDALRTFPNDAVVQLTAGSRYELKWWHADENPRRVPRGPGAVVNRMLMDARYRLRLSLTLDPREDEARLRLLRVLLELGELDDADTLLAGFEWPTTNPVVLYLARLFEGHLRERQGNRAAAARLYDLAIALAPQAQSARIAKAHLAHASGARADAAAAAMEAITSTRPENDPWWVYSDGQVWRFDWYLDRQRRMVRR